MKINAAREVPKARVDSVPMGTVVRYADCHWLVCWSADHYVVDGERLVVDLSDGRVITLSAGCAVEVLPDATLEVGG